MHHSLPEGAECTFLDTSQAHPYAPFSTIKHFRPSGCYISLLHPIYGPLSSDQSQVILHLPSPISLQSYRSYLFHSIMMFFQLPVLGAFFSLATAAFIPNTETSTSASNLIERTAPYGTFINHCDVPGTVAFTFDDGPYVYTEELLDLLANYGVKATFFINGYRLDGNYYLLQRIVNEGHQLASHTYDHLDLTTLDDASMIAQMTRLETRIREAVGVIPTYMRPPFLAVNDHVLSVMSNLGYRVIGSSIDTKDYENDDPSLIGRSVDIFNTQLDQGGNIVLAHDVHEQTVHTLVSLMLDEALARGLQPTTVGGCLGDDAWYR
ncbi:hypothetical protein BJX63DRAFT_181561 [Aspergillus granulosus]|uniref:NodB homology domain-containing protein n=1 Tax=Aspergillus granulosus TaxID=176169 RepID=A0ABR4I354_9EURO